MRNDQQGSPQSGASSGDLSAIKFEIRTIFIALRCWWKFALPAGLLLAAAAGSWVYYSFVPTYRAQAWIEMKERPNQILAAPTESSQRFVANQIQLMKSPILLAKLLSQPEIKSTPEIQHASDKVVALARLLAISRQGNSDYYTLEFSSKSAENATAIVNAVADEYRKDFLRNEESRRQYMVEVLADMKKTKETAVDQAKQLAQSEAELARVEFRDPVLGMAVTKPLTPEEAELAAIMAKVRETDAVVTELDVSVKVAEAGQSAGSVPPAIVEQVLQRELDGIRQAIETEKERKREYEGILVESKRATNPKYQGFLTKIAELEKSLQERTDIRREEIANELAESFKQHIEADLQNRKAQLANAIAVQKTWEGKYDEAVKKLPPSRAGTAQLRFAMDTYEREYSIHSSLADMLNAIQTNSRFEGDRVTIRSLAEVPKTPVEAAPTKKMGMYGGAAFCIPFLLAVAWEHFFRRVNSRQQLEAAGALKVVGEITALPRRKRRGPSAKVGRDLQLFEESVDGLRTYLSLIDTLQGLRVLAVTSAVSREGKTSVAAQLAVSIAGATGEPTLLIDGDLRYPDVHRVFGVDLAPGLAEVLSGDMTDEEVIETDFNETLHLMTAGRLTSSPHRLLGSGEFRALLERLRGAYRYIIVDTPPLLAASEALILARAADACILSARRDFSRLDQVTEAYTRLRSAGVAFAGVVLNGIPTRHYAYKYGSYGYRRRVAANE